MNALARYPATIRVTTPPRQARKPEARRPIRSGRKLHTTRPTNADTPTQIIRKEASAGEVLSRSSNKVGAHIASPTPLVCDRPVRQTSATLRGYLNSSRHGVCSSSGRTAGSAISLESICKAQPIDRRASSRRPRRISQRGDSGTQASDQQGQQGRQQAEPE